MNYVVVLVVFVILVAFVVLAVIALGAVTWWFLTRRLTKVTFGQSRDDLLEDGSFMDWLSKQRTYPLLGRDLDGYFWVFAFGYLGARRLKKNAKAFGVDHR